MLIIQGTIVSAEHVQANGSALNLKSFIADLDVPVIVGGCSNYQTATHLMRTGAAGVIVGTGHGRTTTTDDVLGIAVPMATAIADAAAARRAYLDETGGRYVHVIAAGGIDSSADIAKAIACGADAVMLGEPLSWAAEAPAARLVLAVDRRTSGAAQGLSRPVRSGGGAAAAVADGTGARCRRPDQPVRRAAPGDGQVRVLRPEGVPEGRAQRPRLSPAVRASRSA